MSQLIIPLHPLTPEERSLGIIVRELRRGALMLYPCDTGMALGCMMKNKSAIDRIRRIRSLPANKSMTFLCSSMSNIAEFAQIDNAAYRVIKRLTPGAYTFLLPATRLVPSYAHDDKRKTVGIRIPAATIPAAIISALGEPIISITAKNQNGEEFESIEDAVESLASQVDMVVILQKFSWLDTKPFTGESTIIDATSGVMEIIREGAGLEKALEELGERV